jgi:hypothetical protein
MEVRTVIKGAKYFTGDRILIPHMTGEFFMVDCDEYMPLDELKADYDEEYVESVEDNYIEHEGEKYYYAEWGPFNVTGEWDLISDISGVALIEE